MKLYIFFLSLLLLFYYKVNAQEVKPELQIPSTPGMNIIGIQNAEINSPGNYTGVFTNLISPILSNNGTIPANLAIEFSPYYLQSRDITFKELSRTNIYRDFKFSIASNKVMSVDSNFFSRLGIGFRTNILSGKINNEDSRKIKLNTPAEIHQTIRKINSHLYGNIDKANIDSIICNISDKNLKQKVARIIENNRNDSTFILQELEELNDALDNLVKVDGSKWNLSLRTGHFLELAGAIAIDFPENTIDYGLVNRWGVWLNYTYRPDSKNQVIDFGLLLRMSNYSFDPTVIFEKNSIFGDLGLSISWKIPETNFVFSTEFIGKLGVIDLKTTNNKNEYTFKSVSERKWNASIGYQITPTTLWSISLSDINGNSSYLKNKSMQIMMGISLALISLQK